MTESGDHVVVEIPAALSGRARRPCRGAVVRAHPGTGGQAHRRRGSESFRCHSVGGPSQGAVRRDARDRPRHSWPRSPARTRSPRPRARSRFRVVYDDAAVIVVDKPPGLVVHPDAAHRSGTLVAGLLASYPELARLARARLRRSGPAGDRASPRQGHLRPARRRPHPGGLPVPHSPAGGAHRAPKLPGARLWRASRPRPVSWTPRSGGRCVTRRGWRWQPGGGRRAPTTACSPASANPSRPLTWSFASRQAARTRSACILRPSVIPSSGTCDTGATGKDRARGGRSFMRQGSPS